MGSEMCIRDSIESLQVRATAGSRGRADLADEDCFQFCEVHARLATLGVRCQPGMGTTAKVQAAPVKRSQPLLPEDRRDGVVYVSPRPNNRVSDLRDMGTPRDHALQGDGKPVAFCAFHEI